MTRFFLSRYAQKDLREIREYLNERPSSTDRRTTSSLLQTIRGIADSPLLGMVHSTLTRILGTEVRSRFCDPYRIYYRLDGTAPEIVGILHTSRDNTAIMTGRLH